jgi:hypothetical protein
MKRYTVAGIAATMILAAPGAAFATSFTIDEPLHTPGSLSAPWVASGSVTPFVISDSETPSTALRLTDANNSQTGFALYDEAVSIHRGIDITFHESQWGGTGADGIVFFVKDGADTSTSPGAIGGSMGFAPYISGGSTTDGLSGALLGIGLDAHGNFSQSTSDGTGCTNRFHRGGGNAIVVRGPGQDHEGYCLLADSYHLAHNGMKPLWNGHNSRAAAARVVRVVIDPASASDPRVLVYYEKELVIDIPLPHAFKGVDDVKVGFTAGTGGLNNNHDVWGLSAEAAPPKASDEKLAYTGASETATNVALALGIVAIVAAVALRPRRRSRP